MSIRKHLPRPRLESLEDRCCLSGSPLALGGGVEIYTRDEGHTLVIKGNHEDNTVTLQGDRGDLLTVWSTPGISYRFRDLDNVILDLGDGNDSVLFRTYDPFLTEDKHIRVDTGAGDDRVFFELAKTLPDPFLGATWQTDLLAELDIDVYTGAGNDTVTGRFGMVDGKLDFRAHLGDGNDQADVQIDAVPFGQAVVRLRGGRDRDVLDAVVVRDNLSNPGAIDIICTSGRSTAAS